MQRRQRQEFDVLFLCSLKLRPWLRTSNPYIQIAIITLLPGKISGYNCVRRCCLLTRFYRANAH